MGDWGIDNTSQATPDGLLSVFCLLRTVILVLDWRAAAL